MKISDLIHELKAMQSKHGDLDVYYADGRDNAFEVTAVEVADDTNWEGAPDGKAVFLS